MSRHHPRTKTAVTRPLWFLGLRPSDRPPMLKKPATLIALAIGAPRPPVYRPTRPSATLAGHACAGPDLLAPPNDLPASLAVLNKYTAADARRVDAVGSLPGHSHLSDKAAPRPTEGRTALQGPAGAGFSGIKHSGAGATGCCRTTATAPQQQRGRDADVPPREARLGKGRCQARNTAPSFTTPTAGALSIVNEGTRKRYLTGADFDIESIAHRRRRLVRRRTRPLPAQDRPPGKVLAVFETRVDGKGAQSARPLQCDDAGHLRQLHHRRPPLPWLRRHGRLAGRPVLYPLLEGPLWNAEKKWEHRTAANTCASSNSASQGRMDRPLVEIRPRAERQQQHR